MTATAAPAKYEPNTSHSLRSDTSPPLSEMIANMPEPVPAEPKLIPNEIYPEALQDVAPRPNAEDPLRQDYVTRDASQQGPAPIQNFEGGSDQDNVDVVGFAIAPPDTQGDVGPNHYMQWINLVAIIYDKSGNVVEGPFAGNAFWQGFGGACETNNDGDPITRYDQFADRWMVSQFSIDEGIQCVAVSQTNDPTGSYHRYAFQVSSGANDYPKLNVWPDGYYVTFNEFAPSFTNPVVCAFERDQMLTGGTADQVCFDVAADSTGEYFSLLPATVEGLNPPPAGTPAPIVMAFDDEVWGASPVAGEDYYMIWEFAVDWTDPGSSTLTGPTQVTTAEFDGNMCAFARNCVPQPDTADGLDSLGQFTMFPAIYRNFDSEHPDGAHEALWVSHTTDVDGNDTAGVRWAELRDPAGSPSVHQSGTFAPEDGLHRWMSSISVDDSGNAMLNYSVSSDTVFPSVRYTGRLVSDPLGEMSQGEEELHAGTGSQTGSGNRWGDYSSMSLDESDGCSFWMTNEYYETTGSFDFNTRIGSTQFITCSAAEVGTIAGNVTNVNNGDPVEGATITADDGGGGEFTTTTDASGDYSVLVPAATYDVTAEAFGFGSQTETGVEVVNETTTTVDFALEPSESVTIDGFVTDGSGASWPLYATVHVVPSAGGPETTVYTDPDTGYYVVEDLLASTDYDFTVEAITPAGYVPETRLVATPLSDSQENFALEVDGSGGTCAVPGYESDLAPGTYVLEGFEGDFPPAGWTVTNSSSACGGVPEWTADDPAGRGNMTGGTGAFAIADSDQCGSGSNMVTDMETYSFDASGATELTVEFKQDLNEVFSHNSVTVDAWDGSAWVTILDQTGVEDRGPSDVSVTTTVGAGSADARIRFHYDASWDWWWEVDDVTVYDSETTPGVACTFQGGGLFIGNVTDANTGDGVSASVSLDTGQSTTASDTPDDPNLGDGFYSLFTPLSGNAPGTRTITVEEDGYVTANRDTAATPNSVQRQDFVLDAGMLEALPQELRGRAGIGGTDSELLTLMNNGTADVNFDILEFNMPAPPSAPQGGWPMEQGESPLDPKSSKEDYLTSVQLTSEGVPHIVNADIQEAPAEPTLVAAGDEVDSWSMSTGFGWGAGWDFNTNHVWIANVGASVGGAGDMENYEHTPDGTQTGNTISSSHGGDWGGDLAFNPDTGMLWQVNVGGDNCLYEMDPVNLVATGNTVCGPWSVSQRGVAYNPAADTFFVGGWNDETIYEVASDGTPVRSVAKGGRGFSGMAYNPSTEHLFAQVNEAGQLVYVYDASTPDFDLVGTIELLDSNGDPAFADFEGAGLTFDCDGNLVAPNQITQLVHVNESGETGTFCGGEDIPWFDPVPANGTIPTGGTMDSDGNFDTLDMPPSCPEAHVKVTNDTPYGDVTIPVGLTVEFNDVPEGSFADTFIHGLANAGISFGTGGGDFSPGTDLTRDVMAQWLVRAHYGDEFNPPPATGLVFEDVGPEDFAADEIEFLASEGVVAGCSTDPDLYCPDDSVTRAQMAVFLLATLEGSGYTPPACEGEFGDVSCSSGFAPWIEELAERGITAGCGGGNYCPGDSVSRAQMAVFTSATFGISQCLQ